jgi:hypothetical protein
MKKVILSAMIIAGLAACQGTGDRTYNTDEPERGADPQKSDTTPTSSQSTYHTDSVTGQGSAYDTSNLNNKGNPSSQPNQESQQ